MNKNINFAYMTNKGIYQLMCKGVANGHKQVAVLIDPDKSNTAQLHQIVHNAIAAQVDYFFVGGSLLMQNHTDLCISTIKSNCDIPVVLFPGSVFQISEKADGILFLSLVSGRNPDLLIGKQVEAAPLLYHMDIEVIPTAYLLIDGGKPTSVSYVSNSTPIPADKPPIAVCTALAAKMMGMQLVYMDAGSGASQPVSTAMIESVKKYTQLPLIVGGGIRDLQTAVASCYAGADIIVVGTAIEKNPSLVKKISETIHDLQP